MKILIVTPIFPPDIGGPATYVAGLLEKLPEFVQARVVGLGEKKSIKNKVLGIKYEGEITIISSVLPAWKRQMELFRAIWKALTWADVVYIQGTLTVGLAGMIACWIRRKPYVVKYVGDEGWEGYRSAWGELGLEEYLNKIQNSKFKIQNKNTENKSQQAGGSIKWKDKVLFWLQGLVLRGARAVITPGSYLQSVVRAYYEVEAIDIPNAIDVSQEHKNIKTPSHSASWQSMAGRQEHKNTENPPRTNRIEKRLLYVGRLEPWKQMDEIIEAVKILRDQHHQFWKLTVAGSGPERQSLTELAQTYGLANQVLFLGPVSKAVVIHLIKDSSYVVLPSAYEGLSHTLLEAMAYKTPIIASDIPPNRAVLKNGQLGKLVPLHQPARLAAGLLEPYKADMIEKAYRNVQQHFSWEAHVAQLLKILEP